MSCDFGALLNRFVWCRELFFRLISDTRLMNVISCMTWACIGGSHDWHSSWNPQMYCAMRRFCACAAGAKTILTNFPHLKQLLEHGGAGDDYDTTQGGGIPNDWMTFLFRVIRSYNPSRIELVSSRCDKTSALEDSENQLPYYQTCPQVVANMWWKV